MNEKKSKYTQKMKQKHKSVLQTMKERVIVCVCIPSSRCLPAESFIIDNKSNVHLNTVDIYIRQWQHLNHFTCLALYHFNETDKILT